MKKRKSLIPSVIPLILAICLYVIFNEKIACKPNHAGFWFIFVLGMSLGVALTRFILWAKESKE
jgi:hypothetical protein